MGALSNSILNFWGKVRRTTFIMYIITTQITIYNHNWLFEGKNKTKLSHIHKNLLNPHLPAPIVVSGELALPAPLVVSGELPLPAPLVVSGELHLPAPLVVSGELHLPAPLVVSGELHLSAPFTVSGEMKNMNFIMKSILRKRLFFQTLEKMNSRIVSQIF